MDAVFKIIIFIVVTAGNTLASRASLRKPDSHGFFRFFAFESILVMILLNVEEWFSNPFSALQIVSWVLLLTSIVLAGHGFYLLYRLGRPEAGIENTTTLVQVGAYRYIRHPLYASLLWLGWGVFFKDPSLFGGILVAATSAFLFAAARIEEVENIHRFGSDYMAYMSRTKMFLPFIF